MKTNLSPQYDTGLFREALGMVAADLRNTVRNRAGVAIESVAEECERISLASQRELSTELVDRAARRLRDVESALQRLADGDFGACIDCDGPIPVRRLTAIPWASRCVGCQEAEDRASAVASGPPSNRIWAPDVA